MFYIFHVKLVEMNLCLPVCPMSIQKLFKMVPLRYNLILNWLVLESGTKWFTELIFTKRLVLLMSENCIILVLSLWNITCVLHTA